MSSWLSRRAWRSVRPVADDSGMTLLELVVSMSIMGVVMLLATAGLNGAYATEQKVESSSTARSQLGVAFARLDTEVRYADGISTPGTVGADSYVEFRTTLAGTATCTELRLHGDLLQWRSWPQGMSPLRPDPWTVLASGVSASVPFTFVPATPTVTFQQLRVDFQTSSGTNRTASQASLSQTFPAMNTSLTTSSATVCQEGRAVA